MSRPPFVYLAPAVAGEILEKLAILASEEDLRESYGVTAEQVEECRQRLAKQAGERVFGLLGFSDGMIDALKGEAEDAAEICRDIAGIEPDFAERMKLFKLAGALDQFAASLPSSWSKLITTAHNNHQRKDAEQ